MATDTGGVVSLSIVVNVAHASLKLDMSKKKGGLAFMISKL